MFRSKRELREWVPKISEVHDKAFYDNPNYMPITPAEADQIANSLFLIADPKLIKIILKGDEIAGFLLAYADIALAVQKTRGRLFPFGWFHVLREIRTSPRVVLNGVGMLPEHQGMGGNLLLYVELEKTLRASHFDRAELIQVNVENYRSKSDQERVGVNFNKTHVVYSLKLT
jgi:hypothetical protein